MRISLIACCLTFLPIGNALAQAEFILCQAPGLEDIVIEFDARTFEGHSLSCISGGGGFYADMTPCAPDGGYALSDPSATHDLRTIVDRWQDYRDHNGGVVTFGATTSSYSFRGGWMGAADGYNEKWAFNVSRLTGAGILTEQVPDDDSDESTLSTQTFTCASAEQRF